MYTWTTDYKSKKKKTKIKYFKPVYKIKRQFADPKQYTKRQNEFENAVKVEICKIYLFGNAEIAKKLPIFFETTIFNLTTSKNGQMSKQNYEFIKRCCGGNVSNLQNIDKNKLLADTTVC